MEKLIENIQSKLAATKKVLDNGNQSGAFIQGKTVGFIEAWEYVLAEYRDQYPAWVTILNKVLLFTCGAAFGFIVQYVASHI